MRRSTATRRRRARLYVQAMVAVAQRDGAWDAWERDLDVLTALAADDVVRGYLLNAPVPFDRRIAALDGVVPDAFGPAGRGLARLLVERRDVDLARDIQAGFIQAADAARNVDRVRVTTAVELTAAELAQLRERLALPDRELRLTADTDAELVGGFVVRRGDNLLDLSLRARLHALANALR